MPENPYVTAADAAAVRIAVLGVLALLEAATIPRECCASCGCLCRPLEVCPACHPSTVGALS